MKKLLLITSLFLGFSLPVLADSQLTKRAKEEIRTSAFNKLHFKLMSYASSRSDSKDDYKEELLRWIHTKPDLKNNDYASLIELYKEVCRREENPVIRYKKINDYFYLLAQATAYNASAERSLDSALDTYIGMRLNEEALYKASHAERDSLAYISTATLMTESSSHRRNKILQLINIFDEREHEIMFRGLMASPFAQSFRLENRKQLLAFMLKNFLAGEIIMAWEPFFHPNLLIEYYHQYRNRNDAMTKILLPMTVERLRHLNPILNKRAISFIEKMLAEQEHSFLTDSTLVQTLEQLSNIQSDADIRKRIQSLLMEIKKLTVKEADQFLTAIQNKHLDESGYNRRLSQQQSQDWFFKNCGELLTKSGRNFEEPRRN